MIPYLDFIRRAALGALAVCALGSVPVHAVDTTELDDARSVFLKAVQGDGKAVTTASERFQALYDREPGNLVLRAYLGSCLALQGREALMPWTKMRLAESGLAHLDKAVGQLTPVHETEAIGSVPVAMEVRLVAGSTFLDLPDLFRRFDAGKGVVLEAMRMPSFASLPPAMQSRFHFQAAKVARKEGRKGDEAESLRRMLAADPASPDAATARKRMKELGA